MKYQSEFLHILETRGFIHQGTDLEGLDALMAREKISAYIGFDCTAPSLHVGSLIQIMVLYWLQRCGHTPVVLMGGATTKIGDPTGKDSARPPLDDATIALNMAGIRQVFAKFLDFDGSATRAANKAIMVNNADWLDGLGYMQLLREVGRHFSINRMLTMDSVKLRLERESEMSFLEFNYMIMQAYDFVQLQTSHGCRLQVGGSDQWGNIIAGTELYRRKMAEANAGKENIYAPIFGLTTPLLTTASGAKMGKTADGAVWLNAEQLSPYHYWQFWRNVEDADVGRFLRLFTTDLPLDEIARLEKLQGAEINEAKKILATEVTALCHGRAAAEEAAETARKTFEEGLSGAALPEVLLSSAQLAEGVTAFELFRLAGLAESNGEARKLIRGKGAKINDVPVEDENQRITLAQCTAEGSIKLSAGKKRHALVKPTAP